MLLLLVAGAALLLVYCRFVKPINYWPERGVTRATAIPIFGHTWKQIFRVASHFQIARELYNVDPEKRYIGSHQMMSPTLIIRDPELIKQVCVKDFQYFTDRRMFIDPKVEPIFAKNLFSLKGKEWREMRALLSPSFTGNKMRYMYVLMSEAASNFVEYFKKKDQDVVDVELKDSFLRYTNNVIATVVFGIQVDSLEDQTNEFYIKGKEVTDFSSFTRILKLYGYKLFPRIFRFLGVSIFEGHLIKFFTDIINDTIQHREENGIVRPDMINLLTEARKSVTRPEESDASRGAQTRARNITNEDITSQALIFLFAGFDGVATVMCFVAYELAVNPEIQDRLREEVMDTLEKCEGNVSYEALLKMKYLDMVINEALRKWPVAVISERICTKPYTIEPVLHGEKPIRLNVNDAVWIPHAGLHNDPHYFPDPEKFDPERFSDKDNIKQYSYIPFGVGPRSCIGDRFGLLETKIIIFKILSNFEIVPTGKTPIPIVLSKKAFHPMAEKGFWVGLKRLTKV